MSGTWLQQIQEKTARLRASWQFVFLVIAFAWIGYGAAQEPNGFVAPADPFGVPNAKEDPDADKLFRVYQQQEQEITLMKATLFHELLLERCTDVLPDSVQIQYGGPLHSESQRRGQVVHQPPPDVLDWNIYHSKVIFSVWISTIRTKKTVVKCKVQDEDLFVNVTFVDEGRSVDAKLEELGDKSVKEILAELAGAER